AQDDRLHAVRTGRYHVDRDADQFFDTLDVGAGVGRQLVHRLGADGGLGPARHFFVDRHAGGGFFGADREDVDLTAVDLVAGAELQGLDAVQHVELGQAHAG